ncbi:serine protease [Cystoisospora suis]|uniref:Serine protease n=1 Tax=Cystoisospora suis TaxID=483139 RepID=A0A2C6KRH8_9APIC|nr:serine protease [Cystoisospora suis]
MGKFPSSPTVNAEARHGLLLTARCPCQLLLRRGSTSACRRPGSTPSRAGVLLSLLSLVLALVWAQDLVMQAEGAGGGEAGSWPTSSTALAMQLHRNLLRSYPDKRVANMVFSPLGISRVLRALAAGAGEETLWQLQELTDVRDINLQIPQVYLNPSSAEGDQPAIMIFDHIYVSLAVERNPHFQSFRDVAENTLHVTVSGLDFSASPLVVAEKINFDVAEQTAGFVTEVVWPLSLHPRMELAAISAVHVRCPWEPELFDDEVLRQFYPPYGPHGTVRFIRLRRAATALEYFNGQAVKAVRLPLSDPTLGLYIMMPRVVNAFEGKFEIAPPDVDDLVDELYEGMLDRQANGPPEGPNVLVEVEIPAFTLLPGWNQVDVTRILRGLGIENLFDEERAVMPLLDSERYRPVDIFAHSAGIAVDIRGVGGATGEAEAGSDPPPLRSADFGRTDRITFDRPFMFQLRYQPFNQRSRRCPAREQVVVLSGHLFSAVGAQLQGLHM